ncbi:uncharacterized protein JCM6883_001146 [Sporobolomyces salmoneus]|uniref:uncharacterized protein n=1 Tax=Sporobolomyces salmoneus TaxID=183962 RepID=UPI00317C3581
MVLQNKHKQLASKQYKKSHGIPLNNGSNPSTASDPSRPRETRQERALRLGSNADRYKESDEEEETGDPDEVDEELLAHKQAEAEALHDFLSKQQSKLSETSTPFSKSTQNDSDDDDVDASFAHLRIGKQKGKVVLRDSSELDEMKGLEGEARRAQAIRDLKDRFSVPSPPLSTSTKSSKPSFSAINSTNVRKPPPLPGMKNKDGKLVADETKRGGEDFLDSLL